MLPKTQETEVVTEQKRLDIQSSSQRWELDSLVLIACLRNLQKNETHCWGTTEETLRRACSLLSEERFNEALYFLMNAECDFFEHHYCQEGTAGPFAHRYQLSQNLVISLTYPGKDT